MVDAGGGNGILRILEDMDVDLCHIHSIFVTHEHTDHILGIVWMVRMVAAAMKRENIKVSCRFTATRGWWIPSPPSAA